MQIPFGGENSAPPVVAGAGDTASGKAWVRVPAPPLHGCVSLDKKIVLKILFVFIVL